MTSVHLQDRQFFPVPSESNGLSCHDQGRGNGIVGRDKPRRYNLFLAAMNVLGCGEYEPQATAIQSIYLSKFFDKNIRYADRVYQSAHRNNPLCTTSRVGIENAPNTSGSRDYYYDSTESPTQLSASAFRSPWKDCHDCTAAQQSWFQIPPYTVSFLYIAVIGLWLLSVIEGGV